MKFHIQKQNTFLFFFFVTVSKYEYLFTYDDHLTHVPATQLSVRGILHVDDPADDENAQPGEEKVLHLDGRETTLWSAECPLNWKVIAKAHGK